MALFVGLLEVLLATFASSSVLCRSRWIGTGWVVTDSGSAPNTADIATYTYPSGGVELGVNGSASPSDTAAFSGIKLQMRDRADGTPGDNSGNQDDCQGATVNLTYSAS